MSKKKHTPGPWVLRKEIGWKHGAAKQTIFNFFYKEPGNVLLGFLGIVARGAETQADALLASKAPELLHSLCEFLEREDGYLGEGLEPTWVTTARELVAEIKGGRRGKAKKK